MGAGKEEAKDMIILSQNASIFGMVIKDKIRWDMTE